MIYIASPYSHELPQVRENRYKQVMAYTAHLMRQGKPAFSPIVHTHVLAQVYELPTDFRFWKNYCHQMLDAAKELHVLTLLGYEESVGVQAEIKYYKEYFDYPILYIDMITYEEI